MTSFPHHNILLVEDHVPNITAATALLDSLGYNYLVAMNGADAVKKYTEGTFDLILMDIQMPSISGIDTAKLIRELENKSLRRTPIVAMTAYMYTPDTAKLMDDHFDDLIPKPFHLNYFSTTVGKYCKSK